MTKFIKYFLIIIFYSSKVMAENNYYISTLKKENLSKLKKEWVYRSDIFKDTQTRPTQFKDKIIYLDGYKNLRVLSLYNGKELCANIGKKDRGHHRGVGIFNKSDNEVYAVFVRAGKIKLVNIFNCKEKRNNFNTKTKAPISAPILINKSVAYILYNGAPPVAMDLNNGKILWKANIDEKNKNFLKKKNLSLDLQWDVWGGGFVDLKNDQLIISTANAKPTWTSKNRDGPNLFYNSIVSINLNNGKYKWHFQEIEHDLWNLDLAAPPILLDIGSNAYVAQATKTGQLILLDIISGKPTEEIREDKFNLNTSNKNNYVSMRRFPNWLVYSKNHFYKDDVNNIDEVFTSEAKKKISNSLIGEYLPLTKDNYYIFYGIHGGTQWPGIASTPDGIIVIPSNDIAWRMRLRDPAIFNFKEEFKSLFIDISNITFNNYNLFKSSIKRITNRINKILDYKKVDIESWTRFENKDGIPLNSPPWGTLSAIDIQNKKKIWQIPHGSYKLLENKNINTGSEIFGSPVILSTGIVFMAGTDDQKIRAYSLESGIKIWEDDLPFSSYGSLIVATYENNQYLIVNSSGGTNFQTSPGDAIVAYKLSIN